MIGQQGIAVTVHPATADGLAGALEIDVGSAAPVAFAGLRQLVRGLEAIAPHAVAAARAMHGPEWRWLDPAAPVVGPSLFAIADAPNQRRLFRESEQTYRVLDVVAHLLVDAVDALGRPLVLRGAGRSDLVSLRGVMHAVELSRLLGTSGQLALADWDGVHADAPAGFAATRVAQLAVLQRRMAGVGPSARRVASLAMPSSGADSSLEARYLARVLDSDAAAADRVVAALLAVRACFFSSNYEGATLAIERALEVLDIASPGAAALERAWDALDDASLAIPMLELDRDALFDLAHVRAQLELQRGVVCSFTARGDDALAAFARAAAVPGVSAELRADLHMYRGAVLTKRMGQVDAARREIRAGLALVDGNARAPASLAAAWLHNLYALTCFQTRDLDAARAAEELALACVDQLPGASAAHLKTNLVSNFSVLAEVLRDYPRAIKIWRMFEPLNATIASDSLDKVHAFRLGTLSYLAGDVAGALASLERAFAKAELTGDAFNGEAIAGAIARVHLEHGASDAAAAWYELAIARGRIAGDPLQLARDYAGHALARGERGFEAALAALAANTTHPLEGQSLPVALASGDPSAVRAALPLPRSKLMRPFDVVNVSS